ncbi:MAG: NADH-quinone oxidoreductase subunit J [Actinomycetota bacterium]|jgi:NADH-quinone oxidoreductase subunit J|nr:NADH-quinone oxidoreductase subunit J [Actinomycetota bacterium]
MLATTYAIPDVLVFATAALLIVVGALGVIAMKNPVHSALSLIMSLLGVAVAFLEQSADFLAAVEIIVYAGAIVVLFLFVIMFLGVDKSQHPHVEPLIGQRWFAGLGVFITVAGVVFLMASSHWVSGVPAASTGGTALAPGSGNVTQLGDSVFTTYLLAFEATAGLLIIAVVGAVLLARRERTAEADEIVEVSDAVDIAIDDWVADETEEVDS